MFPGETLIIHFENGLTGLTIRDYFSPQYTPKDQSVPIYPEQLTSSPINLHTHGAHISPRGNADNVLLHIPPGMSNTYTYDIPRNMPQGLYWYHSHLHGLTSAQVYAGLVGLLAVGRTDGNLPLVTEKSIPIRNMALQYNFVFDRAGGLAQLNNLTWPQWVSTITPPKVGELANGTYRPLLAPVNFSQSKPGTKYFTIWYEGPLSIHNRRGSLQFIPSNLQHFITAGGKGESDVPADPTLPDYQRDVQFTVNGQFQPVIKSKAGQTEIWVLANVSDFAYMTVQLTETATGRHPPIAIVGQDGNPYTSVQYPPTDHGIVSRVTPVHTVLRNCTRDEGGPFEVGNQVLTSSHRKLLLSKAMVVNVTETSEQESDRQGSGAACCPPCHFFREVLSNPRPAPGTDRDANRAAVSLVKVADALVEIDVPFLITSHDLLVIEDGMRRTSVRAEMAACAEVVGTEYVRLIAHKRHVGQHCGEPKG